MIAGNSPYSRLAETIARRHGKGGGEFSEIAARIRAERNGAAGRTPVADDAPGDFAAAVARAGARRRGESEPDMPSNPIAAAIVMAGRKARGEA